MELWFWTALIFLLLVLALCLKIYMMRKSAREISELLEEILKTETNSLLMISSRDRCMCRLAAKLNEQLRILRRERHRFQQGDRRLKETVTNLSHDIRTPLTAICGYLDLMEREEKSENISRYVQIIRNRSEILKDLTEELFHYAMVTSWNGDNLTQEDVVLNHVLEECISGCYLQLTEHHIVPEIQIPEQEIHRQLNRNALSRIYENVIRNAAKYSDGDLRISLSNTGEAVFSNRASDLTEVQIERLFERFYTVEDARNSTGLGLAVVKTLTELMGGEIRVQYQNGVIQISISFR